ncbi:MAG: prepilin-type N-terminal cleavage/methylation domain-containing protein [Pseudomonadota bacterium]
MNRPYRSRLRRAVSRGFTLIEMAVVVVIVVTLNVAWPGGTQYPAHLECTFGLGRCDSA